MSTAPTCEELLDEIGVKEVRDDIVDNWRHGVVRHTIYQRESDGTYWRAAYSVSTDGETHGLREGDAAITQVEPVESIAIIYKPVSP